MILTNEIENKIKEFITNNEYEVYSLKEVKDSRGQVLEIIVDKDTSISLDEIVTLSNKVGEFLDTIIKDETPYLLDISSLGAEKPLNLDKLEKYINNYVAIHLSHPYKGLNNLEGDLLEVNEEKIILQYKEKTRTIKAEIERKYIDKAHLAIKF